jgi:hypothetical protein
VAGGFYEGWKCLDEMSNYQVSKEHLESWGLVEIGLKNITRMIKKQ